MRLAKFLEMWKHLEIEGSKETGTLTYFIIKNMVGWKVIRYNFFCMTQIESILNIFAF
jgi:hypothetical protein